MAAMSGNSLPIDYKLGEYAIQAVLGQGGFGITYLAKDTRLNSQVAIKEYFPPAYAAREDSYTIRPSTTVGSEENYEWGLNEFLKEGQALARFKHAHIVRVLRFLETNGTAYMVMEYEEGQSLLAHLKGHGGFLAEPMLLNIFLPILNGLQAVHDAGLLHLDIKPDNIYLRKDGQPMLIDFGSSRQAREDGAANQKVALSRGYAAPEQYPGHGERGPWSDVYGMGASLYRCITSREPVDAIERQQTLTKKRVDPLAPAASFERPHYSAHIRAAVDAALLLEADDRPRTARALQNGLMGKGLTDEQAKAWTGYGRGAGFIGVTRAATEGRVRRGLRRGKREFLLALLVLIATALVVVPKLMVDTGQMSEAELYDRVDEAQDAVRSVPRRLKQFVDESILGNKPTPVATPTVRPRRIAAPEKAPPPFEPAKQIAQTVALPALPLTLAILRDNRVLATALSDGTVQLWDTESGAWMRTLATKVKDYGVVAASPDGRWLAYTGADRAIYLWDAVEDKQAEPLRGHTEAVNAIVFSADGKWLASAGEDAQVLLWDLEHGGKRALKTRASVLALAIAPNGRMLAAADAAGGIQYWDLPGGAELVYSAAQEDALTTLAYSPDGKWVVSGGQNGFLKLMRVGLERDDHAFAGAPETVNSVTYSPDGKWLILAGSSDTVEIRSAETGDVGTRLAGHTRAVQALAVSADGRLLAAGDDDNKVRLWR
jgi:WD40 repeat protein